ncbi:DoxX family protein [Xanthobacter pseudotagetidis]|uniref:DoxX family protein n=1 Tax=Xanthobacter pseudotagetidis TaxID=3119911 RepID=UPI0037268070
MIDTRTAPYGLFLLRAALGLMWVSHALLKVFVFTVAGFSGFLASKGFPAALALPTIGAELIGGLLILAGIYARPVAVLLIPVMLGAMLVHIPNGWIFSAAGGGWEYPAFLVVASLTIALSGEGAFALKPSALIPGLGKRAYA